MLDSVTRRSVLELVKGRLAAWSPSSTSSESSDRPEELEHLTVVERKFSIRLCGVSKARRSMSGGS